MAVGWMVMVWSTEGVRTVPCAQERKQVTQVQKGALEMERQFNGNLLWAA